MCAPTFARKRWLPDVALLMAVAWGACDSSEIPSEAAPAPAPVLDAISPSSALAGDAGFVLTASGRDFQRNSGILWDGSALETSYVSATKLTVAVGPDRLTTAGTINVEVSTPAPGGGRSGSRVFHVNNPEPSVSAIEPPSAVWGSPSFTLMVSGSGFVTASEILWNGSPLVTTLDGSGVLSATIARSDVATLGSREIAVRTPPPGGGTSATTIFEVTLDPAITAYAAIGLRAVDVVHDPVRSLLYASVTGVDPTYANTVAVIDPSTAQVTDTIQVGSDPGPLAIADDSRYLYVGLDGAPTVKRVELSSRTVDLNIDLGADSFFGPYFAEDLVVIPGAAETVVVSRYRKNVSPRHGGVAIFDHDVQRPDATQDHTGSNRIEASASNSLVYGYNNETTEFGVRELLVTSTGLQEGTVWTGRITGFDVDIAYSGEAIFATTGVVVDAATGAALGTFPLAAPGPVAPDAANGRSLFLLPAERWTLAAYRTSTFALIDSAAVPGSGIRRMIRWGTDGVAYVSDGMVATLTTTLVTQ